MRRALLLLSIGVALAASVASAVECPSCGGASPVAIAGSAGYGVLLIVALVRESGLAVRMMCLAASGFHVGLLSAMASRGSFCALCLTAAGGALAATALAIYPHRNSWSLLPVVWPWAAAFGLLAVPSLPMVDAPSHTRIVAYTRSDCPYCDELRDRVLPEAIRGRDVEVQFRDAGAAAFVRRAPTLLLTRGRHSRVLEGLPTVDRLRDALAGLEGGSP